MGNFVFIQFLFFLPRITPPFHTSSPEHERYTPPSERRRGQLFDEEGFLPKNVVGPRNLLEVHVFRGTIILNFVGIPAENEFLINLPDTSFWMMFCVSFFFFQVCQFLSSGGNSTCSSPPPKKKEEY